MATLLKVTMPGDAVSFALTGKPAAMTGSDEPLHATVAPFVLTGSAATLGVKMPATVASYTLTGIGTVRKITMPAGTGVFYATQPPMTELTLVPEEMIVKAWYQEDLADGPVASWTSSGVKPVAATQTDPLLQPTKLAGAAGVLFSAGTKQALTWAVDTDAHLLHRWWVAIARCPAATIPAGASTNVVCINGVSGNGATRQPQVVFRPSLMTSKTSDSTGVIQVDGSCSTDASVWNVIVGWRRGWETQACVNGVNAPAAPLLGWASNNVASASFMGDMITNLPTNVAIDCIIIGQGELTNAMIDKLAGWGMWRVGRQAELPLTHPYRNAAPTGMEDPQRFAFDQAAYDTWLSDTNTIRYTHRGGPAPSRAGYVNVFVDNFSAMSVVDDLTGGSTANWYAPTHLSNIGAGGQTLTLRLYATAGGSWRTGAFSSINKNGQGRAWGKGIFEMRAKFPLMSSPRPGFFPAFWAYNLESLFWRTRNRLEYDFYEYDGLNGAFINTSAHVHSGTLAFSDPDILAVGVSKKIAGYQIGPATGFPALIDIYDGQYHTWAFQIEDDFTYITIDGLEVGRCPTSEELLQPKYIMVDWALRLSENPGDVTQTYDMTIDYIKVMQKP